MRQTTTGMMMDQPRRIDVISDVICPWCWIGKRQMERALAMLDQNFTIHWRPYQLNPDMPAEGVERASYRAAKFGSVERGAELDANVAAAGRAVGLEFRHDRMLRTPNTIAAHRLIRWAGEPIVEPLFQAYFHDGQDIGDHAVLAAIAATIGLDAKAFLASDEGDAEVRAEDAHFRRIGINGVPSFALDGAVMFSGAYPAEHMAQVFGRKAA
ncbi:DsbA family oxidoreductase [Sediminicoccus sp. KRV36]|uniref:DsbA family oxidoreductase n=1 Tax=Sediminicoccus sp. KRV36 TaxID=3133721 RepID=UPI00200DB29D|nr:DsbA family oxidoreductase [Sediminicoccus rosea]UPY35235.1 DsbA family oxidoreductase [Sediminicoccus rosea]